MATKKKTITVVECKCERCGHVWETKKKPLCCARCKTPYWDTKPQQSSAAD